MSKPSKNIFKGSPFAEQEPAETSSGQPAEESVERKAFKTIFKDGVLAEQAPAEAPTGQLSAAPVGRKTFKTIFKTVDLDDAEDVGAAKPDQVLAAESLTKFNKAIKPAKPAAKALKPKAPVSKANAKPKDLVDAGKLDQVELPNMTLPVIEPAVTEHSVKPAEQPLNHKLSTLDVSTTAMPESKKPVKKPAKTKKPSAPKAK